ncbi:MAG TPA: hypothetical protein VKB70_08275 [Gaiellaceae bacterium]|nr:hypothetical protein [Gaiellaceae bacterium]
MARWGPYFFSARRQFREERLLAYIHREHEKGRHLTEILEDPYVERCGSREFVWETLRDTPLIELLGADVREAIQRGSLDAPNQA